MKLTRHRQSRIYQRAGFLHATRDGGPVLLGKSSWRTVSGIFINSRRTGMVMLEFRRVCP